MMKMVMLGRKQNYEILIKIVILNFLFIYFWGLILNLGKRRRRRRQTFIFEVKIAFKSKNKNETKNLELIENLKILNQNNLLKDIKLKILKNIKSEIFDKKYKHIIF